MEELYDVDRDPHCLENLAEKPEWASVKANLADALAAWMKAEGDPGAALDTPEAYYPRSLRKLREDRRADCVGWRLESGCSGLPKGIYASFSCIIRRQSVR